MLYTFYQHVIDVYFNGAPDQVLEDFVNHSLERSASVLEPKGHHLVAVDSSISNEGCLVFILRVYLDLFLPGIDIHKTKELITRRCLQQLINPRNGITISRASLI